MDIRTILLAFNRPEHTRAVLFGMKNSGFDSFDVFIDKAIHSEDIEKQSEILHIIAKVDWATIRIIRRKKNHGLAKSIISSVSQTLKENDAVIVLEDDCVPRQGFKTFMESSLIKLKSNNKVRSICGYSYPPIHNNPKLRKEYYFIERFCPWGWATWKDRWTEFEYSLPSLIRQSRKKRRPISSLGIDIENYCNDPLIINQKIDVWSLNWILIHFLTNTFCLYPKMSLIDNIGFDGSGIHSKSTELFNLSQLHPDGLDLLNFLSGKDIKVDIEYQRIILDFLEKTSKLTMRPINHNA